VIDHMEREQNRAAIHCVHVLFEIWFQKLRDKIARKCSNAPAAFSGQQVCSQAGNINLCKVVRRRWSFPRPRPAVQSCCKRGGDASGISYVRRAFECGGNGVVAKDTPQSGPTLTECPERCSEIV
jgi:hypothetical protein